jgi:carbamoyl-phosphate synthase large subunit
MPRREDLKHVLVIGSGPILIGQAAEFDYSGTQACRVLKAEGLRVTLINSNPATIMTDPEFADATYIEPITPEFVTKVIEKERPDALLPTLGGQTALNAAMALHQAGILEQYGVELIGADVEAIRKGEDRQAFKEVVESIGAESARSAVCHTQEELFAAVADLGYPVVVRPSFTMGGAGGGIAYNAEDLKRIGGGGLHASSTTEVLLEESILGWKEYELELMRDKNDNVVVICSIENLDPLGVHTGDSITVAPAMTLTDREYQNLRDISIDVIRAVGVDTGGCNIQFAVNPDDGRVIVIEMNPRVSRSSALASKATGFPIAKIAAKLAIGYTLDEIPNDITRKTPASFEPSLDYVVVKIPRFAFEKFPGSDPELTTTMKSVGEAMSIGRSFVEALQKAMRSLEQSPSGFWTQPDPELSKAELLRTIRTPTDGRLHLVELALRTGATVEEVFEATKIDRWFLDQLLPRRTPPSRSRCSERPSGWAAATARSPRSGASASSRSGSAATTSGCAPSTRRSTPAPRSSPPRRPTTTPRTTRRPRWRRPPSAKSSSWAAVPTGSGRASSSTTPACTPPSPCTTPASRP